MDFRITPAREMQRRMGLIGLAFTASFHMSEARAAMPPGIRLLNLDEGSNGCLKFVADAGETGLTSTCGDITVLRCAWVQMARLWKCEQHGLDATLLSWTAPAAGATVYIGACKASAMTCRQGLTWWKGMIDSREAANLDDLTSKRPPAF